MEKECPELRGGSADDLPKINLFLYDYREQHDSSHDTAVADRHDRNDILPRDKLHGAYHRADNEQSKGKYLYFFVDFNSFFHADPPHKAFSFRFYPI